VEEKEERREKREQQRESKYKREIENKSKRERETATILRCSYGKIVKERKGKKGMHFS
jgi:hypothetical protein